MTKLEMVKITLKDFKKHGESKKCRFYKNIITGLRTIPCGVRDQNKLKEFYEFLPTNMRSGLKKEIAVEIVLQFYVGYSDAMNNKELKKLLRKIYYQKNRQKFLASAKKSHEKYREKRIKKMKKRYYIKSKNNTKIFRQFRLLYIKESLTKRIEI